MEFIGRIEIAVGVWILVSPWILGYSGLTPALWSAVFSGAAVAILGLWRTFGATRD
ncbi:SPW repeat protein [Candidatus Uhrbacteria bacterium]|nr:SPW repeat protein [Candidatus Uhrbacteria bacterium]